MGSHMQEVTTMSDIHAGAELVQPLDLDALEATAREYEAEASALTSKADAIRQIIEGVLALNGTAGAVLTRRFEAHRTAFEMRALDPTGPRGPKAVMQIITEQNDPDHVWKVVDVKREMLRRGWAPTPKAVEASIKRLRDDGALVQVSYGHYKLPPQAGDPQESIPEVAA